MDSDQGRRPTPARPPKPVRPASQAERKQPAPGPPTPVRSSLQPAQEAPVAPPPPQPAAVSVEVDGVEWIARVDGWGRVGSPPAEASLLLVGFYRTPEAEQPDRETWVVARDLGQIPPGRLVAAFSESRPPLDPDRPRPLFPGTSTRSRKGG